MKKSAKQRLSPNRALLEDLVAASRILADHGVLDAYGHVSVRNPARPENFLISRSLAPALVEARDIMELGPDSEALPGDERKGFLERYIHGEIYRTRPDVMAVVHSHSPSVIPFGVTKARLRPIYHMAGFLWTGAPVYDIRKTKPDNDLLIRDRRLGAALAHSLGKCSCVLMRGHGMTVVGASVQEAVYRSIYTEMNARLQIQAEQLQGPIEFLSDAEGQGATRVGQNTLDRPWELWKTQILKNRVA